MMNSGDELTNDRPIQEPTQEPRVSVHGNKSEVYNSACGARFRFGVHLRERTY